MKHAFALLLFVAAPALLTGCEQPRAVQGTDGQTVSLAQFQQLRDGMSYEEVTKILGSPGVEQSSTSIGDTRTVMYAWNGNTFGANMNAMFQGDKLVSKSQFGLE